MDVTTLSFWEMIGVAVLCGGAIGLERQIRGKPAGIRTSILICLGTSLFISLGIDAVGENTDTTRVLGQVITGIGFLGGGVIIAREGRIEGATSAAVIWVLAAIGAVIGFEKYAEAMVLAFLTVSVLVGLGILEGKYRILRKGVHARRKDQQDLDRPC
ncbi:MAG: MgtC/SapB family protein [Dehalococcoidia bacterium]|nr:MgtC/SapB family protein [Dehalococcoidia bacterium]